MPSGLLKGGVLALVLALPITAAASPPARSVAEDLAACQDEAKPEAERLVSCSRVLTYKSEPGEVFAEALFNRAYAYEGLGKSKEALADYTEAIRLNPEYPAIYFYRGGLHEQLGTLDTALADYSTAIRLDPEFADAYARRGRVQLAKGNADAALADLDIAIAKDNANSEAFAVRGALHERQGRIEQARRDYRRALELDPENAEAQAGMKRVQGA